jgi:hypothetical protein
MSDLGLKNAWTFFLMSMITLGLFYIPFILVLEMTRYIRWLIKTHGAGDYWSSHLIREGVKK